LVKKYDLRSVKRTIDCETNFRKKIERIDFSYEEGKKNSIIITYIITYKILR